jgi:hypothetical protein
MRGLKGVLVAACVCLSLLVGVSSALAAGDANHPNAGECPRVAEEAPGFASLPDCRRYEMVTPPQKNGATIGTAYSVQSQVARSGQRVIAPSTQCFAGPESCVGDRGSNSTGEQYAFTRASNGWVTHPLVPPASFETFAWSSMNADAGTMLFEIPVRLGQEDFYARLSDGSLAAVGPMGEHTSLQEGVVATADLSHVVYQMNGPVWSFDHTAAQQGAVYEYVGTGNSTPLMVGVSGGLGSTSLISTCGTSLGTRSASISRSWGSLSEDGRTVYFTAGGHSNNEGLCPSSVAAPPASELYARIAGELPDARSILISGPTSAACTSEGCKENTGKPERARDAAFVGASTDGSRVFFEDTQQLTDGASEDPNVASSALEGCQGISELGCNLYESECSNGNRCAQSAERRLVDVSEGPGGTPVSGGPRVQGVLAMAADGSRVYFVAKGVLTAASNARGESAQEEADNLYVYSEGRLAFIAALSPLDEGQWAYNTTESLSANTTPDGRFLVFVSHRALTPDDTRAEGPAQVFEYDAATRALRRISIGENGFNGNGNEGALGGGNVYQGVLGGDARIVGASRTAASGSVPVSSDPTMSDDGAFVFFESPVALTPGALNDVVIGCYNGVEENGKCAYRVEFARNVYEYHEGHVFLISDGRDTAASPPIELLGSDASGANVFFLTYDRLVPEDTDTNIDIYDAHICSEREPCPAPKPVAVPCEGEACRGAPQGAPATSQAPGSESLTGPGNLTSIPTMTVKPKTAARTRAMELARALRGCRRDRQKRRRVRCERQVRAHSGSARKTNNNRRAR